MRQDVRRARVHTINKLVRTSKKLKNKHGSEKEKEKYQRKAARFMEEITIIKSLKDDEISKFVLINTKSPDDILNDPKISLREKAMARLSSHPNLIKRLNDFRTKYPLQEDELLKLFEQLVKEDFIEDNLMETSDIEEEQNESPSISEINSSKTVKSKIVKQKKKRKELESNDIVTNSKVSGESLSEVKRFSEILKTNDDNSDNDNRNNEDISDRIPNKTVNEVPEEKTADPFFMCEDGMTEYITIAKKIINESENFGENNFKDYSGYANRRERRQGQFFEPKNFNKKNYHKEHKFSNNRIQLEKRIDDVKEVENTVNESIHPSWEAKKRMKDQQHAISAFQGKKIKFDED
ncbi:hypothetical protein L9F63_010260 [Diploptera punctata]|uniref:Serum response factor-binding protein 1 n=1 Tax=Diploptera punctata TaxID=6984 RepID=A0AAD8AKB6_DIPPU|nr:hypothetical protein L9F63_010260 [Diploptera punctata]